MTIVKLLLMAIGIFNLLISLWIGCAFIFTILRNRNRKNMQSIEDNVSPPVEDGLA